MGMYDGLKVHKSHLPDDLKDFEEGWQTKSLDNMLTFYEITKSGRLREVGGIMQPDDFKPKFVPITGAVRFYQSIDKEFDIKNWREFVAFFKKGKLIEPITRTI